MKKLLLLPFLFLGCDSVQKFIDSTAVPTSGDNTAVTPVTSSDTTIVVKPSENSTPIVVKPPTTSIPKRIALYWENTTEPHPERMPWSDFLAKHLQKNINIYNKAEDITYFCPRFKTLNDPPKVKALGELISAVVYYESGFNPKSWMTEKTMGLDPVTKQQVKSEGLLQLSYQDMKNYGDLTKGCGIDWEKDKSLAQDDARKTIFNPLINLECGMRILTSQVEKKKLIGLETDVYWAVLKKNGKFTKLPEIAARVQKHQPDCVK